MKKLLYLVAIFAALAVAVASCKKDKDKDGEGLTITAQVEKGNDYNEWIKRVRAGEGDMTLASSAYANGGFTLTLPGVVSGDLLGPIEPDEGIEISDPNTKGIMGFIEGFSSTSGDFNESDLAGEFLFGKFELTDTTFTGTLEQYLYVDRACSIIGSYRSPFPSRIEEYVYNVSLNKGWNKVYMTVESKNEGAFQRTSMTSTPVSDMKWYFEDDEDVYWAPAGDLAITHKKNALRNAAKTPLFKRLSAVND